MNNTLLKYSTSEEVLNKVTNLLRTKFDINVIASCKGGAMESLIRPSQQPYFIFEHSESALKYIKGVMSIMGINLTRINDFLRSSFDKKTQVLRWIFMPPATLYNIESDNDCLGFWTQVYNALNNLEK